MSLEDFEKYSVEPAMEIVFPKSIFEEEPENKDEFDNFEQMLTNLNKQVSIVDGNVNNFVKVKMDLEQKLARIDEEQKALEEAKFAFEKQMKQEYQKLEDMKIDFEQEKNKMFNSLQEERDLFEKSKRDFEKHRSEQLMMIEQNKKTLTKNYKQFETIVNNFNEKIDKFGAE